METVEKSLTYMFIRLVRIYPCLFRATSSTKRICHSMRIIGEPLSWPYKLFRVFSRCETDLYVVMYLRSIGKLPPKTQALSGLKCEIFAFLQNGRQNNNCFYYFQLYYS